MTWYGYPPFAGQIIVWEAVWNASTNTVKVRYTYDVDPDVATDFPLQIYWYVHSTGAIIVKDNIAPGSYSDTFTKDKGFYGLGFRPKYTDYIMIIRVEEMEGGDYPEPPPTPEPPIPTEPQWSSVTVMGADRTLQTFQGYVEPWTNEYGRDYRYIIRGAEEYGGGLVYADYEEYQQFLDFLGEPTPPVPLPTPMPTPTPDWIPDIPGLRKVSHLIPIGLAGLVIWGFKEWMERKTSKT